MPDFAPFSVADADRVLFPLGFRRERLPGVEEYVYVRPVDTPRGRRYVHVYSSVDVRTGCTRDAGHDAIRVTAVRYNAQGASVPVLRRAKRVNRTPGWPERLAERVVQAVEALTT